MNRIISSTSAFFIAFLVIAPDSFAQHVPGQAVTFRNFDYVQAVTVSNAYAYYGTTGGLIRYDKQHLQWDMPMTGGDAAPREPIQKLWVDRFDQTLFLGTELSIYQYDSFMDSWSVVAELPSIDNDITHIHTPDILLPQFDAIYSGLGEFVDAHARHFKSTDVVQDAAGDLWMGTWGFGPARADSRSGLMDLLPYGLLQDQVDVIFPDDSIIWFAGRIQQSFRTGLSGYDVTNNTFDDIESGLDGNFPADDIYSLQADSGTLYIGTPRGLYELDKATHIARGPLNANRGLQDDFVVSLARSGDSLLIGTGGGLSLLKMGTDSIYQVRPETFHRQIIYDLDLVDKTVWVASSIGAFRYTFETDRLQQFQDSELVLFSAVLNIEHSGTDVWLASDAGVVRLDIATGKSESFREPSNRHNRRALAVNDRVVALANDRGLVLITPGAKKDRTVVVTEADGLASDNVLSLRFDGDYLWVGTDNGVTRFMWNDSRWVD